MPVDDVSAANLLMMMEASTPGQLLLLCGHAHRGGGGAFASLLGASCFPTIWHGLPHPVPKELSIHPGKPSRFFRMLSFVWSTRATPLSCTWAVSGIMFIGLGVQ